MPLDGWYSPGLVVLSIVIASVASYTALELAARITAARGAERLAWLAGGSVAMGVGIWSMHFIGMLAFHLPMPIRYGLPSCCSRSSWRSAPRHSPCSSRAGRRCGPLALIGGAIWMGPAIAGMHYIGMASLSVEASLGYSIGLVIASVTIAVLASLAGLWLAHRLRGDETRRTRAWRLASALVFGAAIAGMHYTGMAAAQFSTPGHTGYPSGGPAGLRAPRDRRRHRHAAHPRGRPVRRLSPPPDPRPAPRPWSASATPRSSRRWASSPAASPTTSTTC